MRSRILKAVFGIAGTIFLVVAFLEGWDRSQGFPIAGWQRLGWAALSALVALRCGLQAWSTLLAVPARSLAVGFYTSQLGKYVPGAVWQAVGQVGYASSDGISAGRATVGFVTFAVTQAVSGAVLSASLILVPGPAPTWLRLTALSGLGALLLLQRTWLLRIVAWYVRRRQGSAPAEELVPSQGAILLAAGWGGLSLAAAGVGYTLAVPIDPGFGTAVTSIISFVLAWTVGFLAIPFPAGLGIREAVLIAALGATASTAAITAASVVYRLVTMVGEVAAIGVSRIRLALDR